MRILCLTLVLIALAACRPQAADEAAEVSTAPARSAETTATIVNDEDEALPGDGAARGPNDPAPAP